MKLEKEPTASLLLPGFIINERVIMSTTTTSHVFFTVVRQDDTSIVFYEKRSLKLPTNNKLSINFFV